MSRLPMRMPALLLAALALATALLPRPTHAVRALASDHASLPMPSSYAASNGAPVCAQFQTLGSLSGVMRTLAVSGTLAYVGMGDITAPSLGILDVGDPITPTLRSNYALPGYVRDIQVVGTLVYIADDSGLDIIDISDPDQPSLRGSLTMSPTLSIQVVGGWAYIAAGGQGWQIVNVSEPAHPTLLATHHTMLFVSDIQVVDTRAYITGNSGLQIFDTADPANPVQRGSSIGLSYVATVQVKGTFAYLLSDFFPPSFDILDVHDPAHLHVLGNYIEETPYTNYSHLQVVGNLFFTAYNTGHLFGTFTGWVRVWNAGNPGSLEVCGEYHSPTAGVNDFQVIGDFVYMVDADGLRIARISYFAVPSRWAFLPMVQR